MEVWIYAMAYCVPESEHTVCYGCGDEERVLVSVVC
jgi:hypothetical protein